MTKDVSSGLQAHFADDVQTLCTIWTITRVDGTIFRFTDHDTDVIVGGETYAARVGYSMADVETSAGFSVGNVDVDAIMSSSSITEDDLQAGFWDFATIQVDVVNYVTPSLGTMTLRYGTLGQVSLVRDSYKAELRGLSQSYQQGMVQLYSQMCRARFGDSRCQYPLNYVTVAATVTAVDSRRTFTANVTGGILLPNAYVYGVASFLTGNNAGVAMEIKLDSWISGTSRILTLQLPLTQEITVGDTLTVRPGCSKTIEACNLYGNTDNFRGEPYVPVIDQIDKGNIK